MQIKKQWFGERYGNDSVLKYNLLVIEEWGETHIQLKENHNGWAGKVLESRSVCVSDGYTEEKAAAIVNMVDDFSETHQERHSMLFALMSYVEVEWRDYFCVRAKDGETPETEEVEDVN